MFTFYNDIFPRKIRKKISSHFLCDHRKEEREEEEALIGKEKKREKTLSFLVSTVIASSSSNAFFFTARTHREKKRQRDASKRPLARPVPPNPTRCDSVNVRETSNERPFGFAIFFRAQTSPSA